MERYAGARFQTSLVENGCHFLLGVLIEEIVNGANHLSRGATKLKGLDGARQLQGACCTTPEADMSFDQIACNQSDVLDEESQQPFNRSLAHRVPLQ